MKKWLILGVVITFGCTGDGPPTGPSPQDVGVETNEVTVETIPPTGGIDITQIGTVIIETDEILTACLYNAEVIHDQTLINSYRVRPGKNALQVDGLEGLCGKVYLQLDVQDGAVCPFKAHPFDGYRGGRRFLYNTNVPCTKPTPTPTPVPTPSPTPTPCVPGDWNVISEQTTEGEWGECPGVQATCNECRETTTIRTEFNGCEERELIIEGTETREVECPVECVTPAAGLTLSWTGKGDPQTECETFGPYDATEGAGDFYLCKAGNDREVVYPPLPTGTCGNGKDISHITGCVCQ